MYGNGGMFVARLVGSARDWMVANAPTSRAFTMFVQTKERTDNNRFAKVAAKTRPKIVPLAAIYWDVSARNIEQPMPDKSNNMHHILLNYLDGT